ARRPRAGDRARSAPVRREARSSSPGDTAPAGASIPDAAPCLAAARRPFRARPGSGALHGSERLCAAVLPRGLAARPAGARSSRRRLACGCLATRSAAGGMRSRGRRGRATPHLGPPDRAVRALAPGRNRRSRPGPRRRCDRGRDPRYLPGASAQRRKLDSCDSGYKTPALTVLRNIESKIESLFEGVFGRAFRTNVQPVELARKLVKEMEDHPLFSLSRLYVPNEYTVYLSPVDREQFESYEESLLAELQDYLAENARREKYVMLSPPKVLMETDEDLEVGEFGIATRMAQ